MFSPTAHVSATIRVRPRSLTFPLILDERTVVNTTVWVNPSSLSMPVPMFELSLISRTIAANQNPFSMSISIQDLASVLILPNIQSSFVLIDRICMLFGHQVQKRHSLEATPQRQSVEHFGSLFELAIDSGLETIAVHRLNQIEPRLPPMHVGQHSLRYAVVFPRSAENSPIASTV